jgi:hypothetical protein
MKIIYVLLVALYFIGNAFATDLSQGIKGLRLNSSKSAAFKVLRDNFGETHPVCDKPDSINPGYEIYDEECVWMPYDAKNTYSSEQLGLSSLYFIGNKLKTVTIRFSAGISGQRQQQRMQAVVRNLSDAFGQPYSTGGGEKYLWSDTKNTSYLKVTWIYVPSGEKIVGLEYCDLPTKINRINAERALELRKKDL